MNNNQWEFFCNFRENFRNYCDSLNSKYKDELFYLQKKASELDTPEYPLETSVVYNTDLDSITENSNIRLIVIGDNPGKNEQLSINQKYLVGQSGKLANSFFKNNPDLQTDFRKNVIILNKTPIHTAKTKHLKYLIKNGSPEIKNIILESQTYMATQTALLHQKLYKLANPSTVFPQLWLVGYSELKDNGIFQEYKTKLINSYFHDKEIWNSTVLLFQHFSMNCFSKDLKNYMNIHKNLNIIDSLNNLGKMHKSEIFGDILF